MPKKMPERTYVVDKRRVSIINLKGSVGYREWLNDVSNDSRIASAVIVRDALAAWAKANGYQKPPEI